MEGKARTEFTRNGCAIDRLQLPAMGRILAEHPGIPTQIRPDRKMSVLWRTIVITNSPSHLSRERKEP